ncbi:MAG: DPP IV N-terminal domain-containing protein, partial [Bacteroidales bacterium]|nr:DPP IV N-terminal domain-containing protein [Bacteroidales bacterium]
MRKKILIIAMLLAVVPAAVSQNKMLKWDQLMDRSLYPQREMMSFIFAPDGKTVTYYKGGEDKGYYAFDGKKEFKLSEEQLDWRKPQNNDPKLEERVELKEGNLYVDGNLVERGDGYNIVLGESVHRNEFGIECGLFWSPKHNRLAFYRMDQSMVVDYPLVNTKAREAEVRNIKYPMAGMKSHEVTVGVWDAATQKLVYLNTARDTTVHEREMYLTNIAWSPDEQYVFIAKVNREQNHMWLEQYDAVTGAFMKVLFEETNSRYVEPCEPMIFTPKGDQFLWYSMRDGYKHLYLYNIDGTLVKQVTKGEYEVEGFIQFDKKGENIFIYANKNNLDGRDAYRVNLKNGTMECLTNYNSAEGTHTVVINDEGTRMVDYFSAVDNPGEVNYVININKPANHRDYNIYRAENPLKDYAMPGVELGTIKAADGKTDLYYRLITPPNMEKGKKYPTL